MSGHRGDAGRRAPAALWWLLPVLLLAGSVASAFVVDALGGGWPIRGLISGLCCGLASALATRRLRTGWRDQ